MIRILQHSSLFSAPLAALGVFMCAASLSTTTTPAHADDMYRAAPGSMTVFTEYLPQELTIGARLSGLSVLEIEHLNALEADLVHIQMGEDHIPENIVNILNATFPQARFQIFEDFKIEEASADLAFK